MALGLISVALLGLMSMQAFALKTQRKSTRRHTASVIASSLMAETEKSVRDDFETDTARSRGPANEPEYEVEIVETVGPDDLKRVEVRVFWSDDQGDQSYRLWTKFIRE